MKTAAPRSLAAAWLAAVLFSLPAAPAVAQLGSGWVQYSPTKRIHLDDDAGLQTFAWSSYQSVCSPICADYRYDSGTDTEIFRVIDARSNRSEIRLHNDYTTGRRQFEGYLTFFPPDNDPGVFQLWGSTSGATLMIMRVWAESGGTISTVGISGTVATQAYGIEHRINIIHDQNNYVRVYRNGSLRVSGTENESAAVYHKYGAYGNNARAGNVLVHWRRARSFRDGQPPGSTSPTPTPAPTATPGSTPTPGPTPTPCTGCTFSGFYRLTARHSGKAVVVQSASTANNANVFQWTYGGTTANDEWELRGIGGGYYRVINRHSGKDLTVSGASTANAANVVQYTYGGTAANDEWQPVSLGNGYYRIVNRHSGKVLNVSGASTADGANVDQWSWASVNQQQFQLVSVP